MSRHRLAPALLAALIAAAPLSLAAQPAAQPAAKGPATYVWPRETTQFIAAPGIEQAQRHCLACHSADYVGTQPRGMPEAFWTGEVAKMRTAYGAPMTDDDARAVAAYLSANYGAAAPGAR
jgi:mono/diheme cytochrome c family protein